MSVMFGVTYRLNLKIQMKTKQLCHSLIHRTGSSRVLNTIGWLHINAILAFKKDYLFRTNAKVTYGVANLRWFLQKSLGS